MSKRLSQIGEFGLIDLIKRQVGPLPSTVQGIGDDTAVVPLSSSKHLLLTTDMLLEGVHFTLKMPARAVGHKALAASISDVAAMGGVPKYAVVSLGAPAACSKSFVLDMYQGMKTAAKKFNIMIVGGDTVKSKKMIINVTLTGEVKKNEVIYRSGARCGDQIFVTGSLGKSLPSGWHLRFTPPLAQSQYLVQKYKPTAMIDISDGLAADLGHILTASRVGAVIEDDQIPLRRTARLKDALYDGEDFELLFTLPALKARKLQSQKRKGFSFYRIGEVVHKNQGLRLKTADGPINLDAKGYTHF